VITGELPFKGDTVKDYLKNVIDEANEIPKLPDWAPKIWKDIVGKLLVRDPKKRPTAKRVSKQAGTVSILAHTYSIEDFPIEGLEERLGPKIYPGFLEYMKGLGQVSFPTIYLPKKEPISTNFEDQSIEAILRKGEEVPTGLSAMKQGDFRISAVVDEGSHYRIKQVCFQEFFFEFISKVEKGSKSLKFEDIVFIKDSSISIVELDSETTQGFFHQKQWTGTVITVLSVNETLGYGFAEDGNGNRFLGTF
jgi:serine/threonine protein kinase